MICLKYTRRWYPRCFNNDYFEIKSDQRVTCHIVFLSKYDHMYQAKGKSNVQVFVHHVGFYQLG